jgi:hypothetical protein
MSKIEVDKDNQVILKVSEEDQIAMDLHDIFKACEGLKKPMDNRGLRYKVEAIERLVKDMSHRISSDV